MKLPKIFIPEKNLEIKTEELLIQKDPKKVNVTFSDYIQIRYTTEGTSWAIEYGFNLEEYQWMLSNKEFGEQRWFKDRLDKLAKTILKNRINPLIELLNLKEEDYSIEKDNFKSILNRYATKVFEGKDGIKDKEYGECCTILYEKDNLTIVLKEFEKINLGRIDVLDDS